MADPRHTARPTVAPEPQAGNGAAGTNAATAAAAAQAPQAPRPGVSDELMAKANEMAATVSNQVSGGAAQGRAILLPNGMRRVDYIKARWAAGAGRGQIVKELKAMGHENISYQVVFAATKDTKPSGTPAGTQQAPETAAETKPAE